jgi:hypothetical protein
VAIILHNMAVDVEGGTSGAAFSHIHTHREEEEDLGPHEQQGQAGDDEADGQAKRAQLTDELLAYRQQRHND